MRGGVAISVTAMPAAAPRRIKEVLRIIVREPSGLRLRPTMGLDRRVSRPCGTPHRVRVGLHRPLWQRPIVAISAMGSPVTRAGPVNRYPLHPSEQDMISAAGIKDQELTIIVSMMLIELALLFLTRATFFKRLALLDTQRRHFAIYLLIAEPTRRPGADENVSRLSGSRVESLGVFAASFEDMPMTS